VYAHIQQASSTTIITSAKFSIDQEVMAMVLIYEPSEVILELGFLLCSI
jgi:hypothetical protein